MSECRLSEPDLIVNPDGSVYHLKLTPDQLADTVLIMGDPARVGEVSSFFDHTECRVSNREFITHTGFYKGKRITALSTGIGTDNIDIVLQELDALVNFDLSSRKPYPERRSLQIIRIGTSGAIQPDIPLNSLALSTHAMGLDNLIWFYAGHETILDRELTEAFDLTVEWHPALSRPYFVKGSERLTDHFSRYLPEAVRGITITAPGFYGPQGRVLHLRLTDPEMISRLQSFRCGNHRITNFEMETSALYGLGRLMGHETLTVCAMIANRATGAYNSHHEPVIRNLIRQILETLIR